MSTGEIGTALGLIIGLFGGSLQLFPASPATTLERKTKNTTC